MSTMKTKQTYFAKPPAATLPQSSSKRSSWIEALRNDLSASPGYFTPHRSSPHKGRVLSSGFCRQVTIH